VIGTVPEVSVPVESNVSVLGNPLNGVPDAGHATDTVNVAPAGTEPDTDLDTVRLPVAVPPPQQCEMTSCGLPVSLKTPVANVAGELSKVAPAAVTTYHFAVPPVKVFGGVTPLAEGPPLNW
jgi:hypothetical protein